MSDLFDRISADDLLDRVELPVEERAIFSPEMRKLINEELRTMVAALPVGQMITKVLSQEMEKQKESESRTSERISKAKSELKNEVDRLRKELEETQEKLRKKYAELKNEMLQPRYEFGGYPLANGGLPFATWRLKEDGDNLSFQKLVNGNWVEAFAVTPNA